MTQTAFILEFLMTIIDDCDTALAENTLISEGVMTDPTAIRQNAVENSRLLGILRESITAVFSDDSEAKESMAAAIALINE